METRDCESLIRILESKPILNGELVYLARHEGPPRSRKYVDAIESPKAFILTWHEPGEEPAAWVRGNEAMAWLAGNPIASKFTIITMDDGMIVPSGLRVAKEGTLVIYSTGKYDFKPQQGAEVVELAPDDAPALYEMGKDTIIKDEEYMRELFSRGPQFGIRGEDRRPIAWAGICWQTESAAETGVCVRADLRRTGLGKAVVSHATRWVLDSGRAPRRPQGGRGGKADRVSLSPFYQTGKENLGSRRLCESLGYELLGTHTYYHVLSG